MMEGSYPISISLCGFHKLDACKRKDGKMTFDEWKSLAEQGIAGAQSNLGLMYEKGQGFEQDYVEAHKWFNIFA